MSTTRVTGPSRPNRPAKIDTSKNTESSPITSLPGLPAEAELITSASDGKVSGAFEPLDTFKVGVSEDTDISSLSSLEELPENDEEVSQNDTPPSKVATHHADTSKASRANPAANDKVPLKRSLSASDSPPEKRSKVNKTPDYELESDGTIHLPFQTIKAIKMPSRKDGGPPGEFEYPYGKEENWQNTMIIYWLDEEDRSYNETTQLFAEKFPDCKAVEEAIRRRHIRALLRLAKKYGVKKPHEIHGIGKNTARRGKKRTTRGAKVGVRTPPNTVKVGDSAANIKQDVDDSYVSPASTPSFKQVPKYVRHSYKAIEKAAIVVWKDLEGMDYKTIRERLDDKYNWSLGKATVEKYYHLTRPKVYGAVSDLEAITRLDDASSRVGRGVEVNYETGEDEHTSEEV
ncbi:hypothetical protein K458DRAFT_430373 [Lentithecium fluviatile CBS 122367]|uniref:Uncharacterized protein n=1 Tax=Lentithecium fluviatile CBS 122367 TaxID=1168545 RepID=A0A6G1J5V8_9PLEO|nr:hypothetical protein K458DRAFT_430373 [Lentithecium fluviatile CBS 122367]